MNAEIKVAGVSRKGQVTIPKRLREKYGITDKVVVEEVESGILLTAVPSPEDDLGSLKPFFKGRTARQLLHELR
jgi:AbrB family looped-hinge helix DNA binding protein